MESSIMKIECTLKDLESRTKKLEGFETTAGKDIEDLKHRLSFMGTQMEDSKQVWNNKLVKHDEASQKRG